MKRLMMAGFALGVLMGCGLFLGCGDNEHLPYPDKVDFTQSALSYPSGCTVANTIKMAVPSTGVDWTSRDANIAWYFTTSGFIGNQPGASNIQRFGGSGNIASWTMSDISSVGFSCDATIVKSVVKPVIGMCPLGTTAAAPGCLPTGCQERWSTVSGSCTFVDGTVVTLGGSNYFNWEIGEYPSRYNPAFPNKAYYSGILHYSAIQIAEYIRADSVGSYIGPDFTADGL